MKVKELIEIESQLLHVFSQNMFEIPFQDYIILKNMTDKIGNITNTYFTFMLEFSKRIGTEKLSYEQKKEQINNKNNLILQTDINIDNINLDIISKYINIYK